MKKVLLIGKFNDTLEGINKYLTNYFQVQVCIDNIELIKIHTDNKIIKPITSKETDTITSVVSNQATEQQKKTESSSQVKSIKQLNMERAEDSKKIDIKSAPDRIRKNTGPIIRRTISKQETKK